MNKETQIDIDITVEAMASVIREITVKCGKCEYYKDGSCLKPIDIGCNINEDILNECDALYNANYCKKKEGRWKGAGMGDYYCSLCNTTYSSGDEYNYCPNCGAKMKEDE